MHKSSEKGHCRNTLTFQDWPGTWAHSLLNLPRRCDPKPGMPWPLCLHGAGGVWHLSHAHRPSFVAGPWGTISHHPHGQASRVRPGREGNGSWTQLIVGDFRSNGKVERHRGTPRWLTVGVFVLDAAKRWSGYFWISLTIQILNKGTTMTKHGTPADLGTKN